MQMRRQFQAGLDRLVGESVILGALAADAVESSLQQLLEGDRAGARRLIERDAQINQRRQRIELDLLGQIATQQPVARDMRLVAAMLELAGELERIGDYAKGIARIHLRMEEAVPIEQAAQLRAMSELAVAMLRDVLSAFEQMDAVAAREIIARDDAVDAHFLKLFQAVMRWDGGDEAVLERANYLLWIAHNLERTADRVTNIGERVIFMVTGSLEGSVHDAASSSKAGDSIGPRPAA
jgi:phosphate transport system protein